MIQEIISVCRHKADFVAQRHLKFKDNSSITLNKRCCFLVTFNLFFLSENWPGLGFVFLLLKSQNKVLPVSHPQKWQTSTWVHCRLKARIPLNRFLTSSMLANHKPLSTAVQPQHTVGCFLCFLVALVGA